nr:hypothetical protein [Tanacetum cinerariifolium]
MMKKSSSSENEPCCSKDCKKNTDSLNSKIEDLKSKLSESDIYRYSYKLGVDQLEGRLVEYKEREVKYIEKIRTLEFYYEGKVEYIETLKKELKTLKEENDVVDGKLARLLKSSKDLENIIESQSRPSPTVESTSAEGQNKISTTAENGESTDSILSKPAVKFVKAAERPTTDKVETVKKPAVRYAEMYRRTSKRRRVQMETTRSQNHAYKSPYHRSYGAPMRPSHGPAGHRPHGPPIRPQYRALWVPTVNRNFPPVNRKLPTGNSNVSTVCCCCSRHVNSARPKAVINRRNRVKDVQASACWVWKSVKPNSASIILKIYDYVDEEGTTGDN